MEYWCWVVRLLIAFGKSSMEEAGQLSVYHINILTSTFSNGSKGRSWGIHRGLGNKLRRGWWLCRSERRSMDHISKKRSILKRHRRRSSQKKRRNSRGIDDNLLIGSSKGVNFDGRGRRARVNGSNRSQGWIHGCVNVDSELVNISYGWLLQYVKSDIITVKQALLSFALTWK